MDSVMIKNAQGEQLNINVIRYFRLNGVEYLVFSLNEVDEGGYVKLYIAKVNGESANTITDDVEWNLIKDTIKTIIKSNKDSLPLAITDLDVRKLSNVQVLEQKVFKLSETFLQLLGANKKVEPYVEPIQNISMQQESTSVAEQPVESIGVEPIQPDLVSTPVAPIPTLEESVSTEPVVQPTTPTIDNFINPVTPNSTFSESVIQPAQPEVLEQVVQPVAPAIENFVNSIEPTPVVDANVVENNILVPESNVADLGNNADYGLDYKTLYENELNKNKSLTEEIEKYKTMINNLKNILNETQTI